LNRDELLKTLADLNIEVANVRDDEINGYCPAHVDRTGHADRSPSWWINVYTGAHICFSCQYKGSLRSLVKYIKGDVDYFHQTDPFAELSARLQTAINPTPIKEPEYVDISEANLVTFIDPPALLLRSRGLTVEAAKKHEILYDERQQCWILTIRDPYTNKLLGWQEKGTVNRFFKNYPTGIKKSKSLFGYKQYEGGAMIVVESPLDVARMTSVGVGGGVSTYGALISKDQVNLIRGANRIIFALDNDDAGKASSEEMLKMSRDLNFECWFFNYHHTDQKDIGGMSKDEILSGIENAKHSLHGRKAFA
jgi:hypothetical protein